MPFRKISTPANQVKLRYFSQCIQEETGQRKLIFWHILRSDSFWNVKDTFLRYSGIDKDFLQKEMKPASFPSLNLQTMRLELSHIIFTKTVRIWICWVGFFIIASVTANCIKCIWSCYYSEWRCYSLFGQTTRGKTFQSCPKQKIFAVSNKKKIILTQNYFNWNSRHLHVRLNN